MNDFIASDNVSSYTVAALLHQWGIAPRVKDAVQVDFSFERYQFSCVVKERMLILHFGDVIFKQQEPIVLDVIQAELGFINKRLDNSFVCLSAFQTKKHEVGVEFSYGLPIVNCLVVDHLHFSLKYFLNGCVDVLKALSVQGYSTLVNYLLDDSELTQSKPSMAESLTSVAEFSGSETTGTEITGSASVSPTHSNTSASQSVAAPPSVVKRGRCFSCDGLGAYANGCCCSICHGSGVSPEYAARTGARTQTEQQSIELSKGKPVPPHKSAMSHASAKGQLSAYAACYTGSHVAAEHAGNTESWYEESAMQDSNLSDFSAEMGHDGDDF
ncbi:hypothetical protein FLM48_16970 [Shewanella sp. Scap07]|uniref:hypothetical protein n=1 Tax=Shewanella sp. Scap07 TaxID=2589987 RepID=UPI0015B8B5BE|nr:hypothetical protein [Shewanella sp. Scap07]QLE86614.1 hypothetical protein FLM48_16970 [Shewanella sp. Scap07]